MLVVIKYALNEPMSFNWPSFFGSHKAKWGQSWSWSYGGWIYNYLCKQCLSSLTLWVRIPLRRGLLNTTLCDYVCQWLSAGHWFSPGTPVSSTNKSDRHDIAEILLKVALNTITLTPQSKIFFFLIFFY
jgi:hypothetical protein